MAKRARKTGPTKAAIKRGKELGKARDRLGMTQENVAFAVRPYLPPSRWPVASTISRIESGDIEWPQPYLIAAIGEVVGLKLRDIDVDLRDEGLQIIGLLQGQCAPWESNPEPADFLEPLALAA